MGIGRIGARKGAKAGGMTPPLRGEKDDTCYRGCRAIGDRCRGGVG